MMNFVTSVVFSAAFGASVCAIVITVRDSWPRILEVLSYDIG